MPWFVAVLAAVLALPAVRYGLATDDETFLYGVQHGLTHPLWMFTSDPWMVDGGMERWAFSWWSNPALAMNFFRPVSSLSHYVEYRFWPHAAWFMHLVNALFYAASVWVAARLYRELIPDRMTAGLAALMFAIDDAHAHAVGWISSRNTLIAGLCALAALLTHATARRRGSRGLQVASVLWTALALGAAEAGVSSLAYLVAYSVTRESGTWRQRFIAIAPQLGVFLLWALWYVSQQHGIRGSSFYRGLDHPGMLLWQGILDLPLWLLSLLGPSVVGMAIASPAAGARWLALLLVLPLIAAIGLRWRRLGTRTYDVFALSVLLCISPLFTAAPQDRVLFSAGFGAFAVIAAFIRSVAADDAGLAPRVARACFVFCHFLLAPLLFVPILGSLVPFQRASQDLASHMGDTPPNHVVLLNSPMELLPFYGAFTFGNTHTSLPEPLHMLYAGASALDVVRLDDRTLEVTAERGWGEVPFERVFASEESIPRAGQTRDRGDLHVLVMTSTASGMPERVRFSFHDALSVPERRWLIWDGTRPVPWVLPPVGEHLRVPALNLATALPR